MGCASSAPLVQQGLDAARKVVSKDAAEDKAKSMAKEAMESEQGKGIMESVTKTKDEVVEKIEGKCKSVSNPKFMLIKQYP
ncbi:hypothetical protein O3M35_011438 [Rhynocoris fuscipes]|uniref:Uncharacterized protein n=1 Tax=Rhynocoris fuscipes TaxID=488301 RepID=A0AAW1CYI9_9HEMI